MKVDTEAKYQGLQLLPDKFFRFSIGKLRNIEFFFPAKGLFFMQLAKKGQSSTSRSTPRCTRPPGHTKPKNSAVGGGRSSF